MHLIANVLLAILSHQTLTSSCSSEFTTQRHRPVESDEQGSYGLRTNAAETAYDNHRSMSNKQMTNKIQKKNIENNNNNNHHKDTSIDEIHYEPHDFLKTSDELLFESRANYEADRDYQFPIDYGSEMDYGHDEDYGMKLPDLYPEPTKDQIEKHTKKYLEKLSLTENQIKMLEVRTRKQHQCSEWYTERRKRLTASIFGRICKLRQNTSRAKTVHDILYGTFTGNAATRWGVLNEDTAKEELAERLTKKILPSGLIIDSDLPFIAASPDGVIDNDTLVEIKCPASAQEFTPSDGIMAGKIKSCVIKKGRLYLKRTDNYYYQVQGQLHITRRKYCYFCIWTPKGMMYELIERDDVFWKKKIKSKIETFYLQSFLPALVREEISVY